MFLHLKRKAVSYYDKLKTTPKLLCGLLREAVNHGLSPSDLFDDDDLVKHMRGVDCRPEEIFEEWELRDWAFENGWKEIE